ncbi:MAG TPA: PBP1A family penicillin-binding protein [Gemmatimonadaceae bacterium]|nr:PBP1A family penicillin-binding protein [Gemmatimonadaceae bacterium]
MYLKTVTSATAQRMKLLGSRLRADPGRPARVWMRERWRSLALLGAAVVAVLAADLWLYTCGFDGCPSPAEIRSFHPVEGSQVYDRHGRLLGQLTLVRRINVKLDDVPADVRHAFVATEDRRFRSHDGVDWHGAARALVHNVTSMDVREGFSTITMQVARNTFAARYMGERSLRRKFLELRLSRLLERSLTKDQILQLYLNVIYLGNGTYGVEAASRDLFGKHVGELTLAEAAALAALPKAPSVYTPRRHPRLARARRDLVLSLMAREGYITPARAAAAARQPLRVARSVWRPTLGHSYALDEVRSVVDSVLGADALDAMDVVVATTLDARAQRAAERAVRDQAAAIDRRARSGARRSSRVQGALVALDPHTGDVLALVGGREYEPGGFDRALDARRQPGSAFKPFVYAAALGAGFTPATMVDDLPVEVEQDGRVWTPANYGDDYTGRITLRHALARSSNVAAVRLSRSVGEARVVDVAHRAGIASPLTPVPSIALGAEEVTPMELVTAYAAFANGGYRVRPRIVDRIETRDGRVLWHAPPASAVRVLDARDVFQLTSMLRSVVDEGTGHVVRDYGVDGPIAGKTGTTNDGNDVWFVGYTPSLVAGVWFGYDTPQSLGAGAAGGSLAAPAWVRFYVRGWDETGSEDDWTPPSGMVSAVIDDETGYLANEWCPSPRREWFKAGTAPTEYCPVHTEPDVWWGEEIGRRLGDAFKRIFHF